MKSIISVIIQSALILAFVNSQLNPVNPNFDYPETNLINKTLGNIPYPGDIYDGYIQVNNDTGSRIFYVLYPAGGNTNPATINNSAPLILWLQGGPGCSDGAGTYLEIGPITVVNQSGNLVPTLQNITWNDQYNLLFVDSPVGVGYSVSGGETVNTAMEAAEDLQIFLIRFFQVYSSLAPNDFYIFGESFGGHYIPALSTIIVSNNSQNGINIKGLGVGDGWTDPYYQLTSFGDYCFATGLLDEHQRDFIQGMETAAQNAILSGQFAEATNWFDLITGNITEFNSNVDIYNFQIYDLPSDFPYDDYLESTVGKAAYGVDPSVTYQDCVSDVYSDFFTDIGTSYVTNYTFLLTQNYVPNLKILLYSGQNDIICNTLGTMRYLTNLNWLGLPQFELAPRTAFNATNGTALGFFKTFQRLSFSVVYNGGHMLPWDQPLGARMMLQRFITGNFNYEEEEIIA